MSHSEHDSGLYWHLCGCTPHITMCGVHKTKMRTIDGRLSCSLSQGSHTQTHAPTHTREAFQICLVLKWVLSINTQYFNYFKRQHKTEGKNETWKCGICLSCRVISFLDELLVTHVARVSCGLCSNTSLWKQQYVLYVLAHTCDIDIRYWVLVAVQKG